MATVTWDQVYQLLGIKDFIYFIDSPSIQDALFPIKLVFIAFTLFFLCAVIYFYYNSTYLKYKFLQDTSEFLSWRAYGLGDVSKRWEAIMKKTQSGLESEYKLAIIDADDFLYQTLEEKGFNGENFEELLNDAKKRISIDADTIMEDHRIRNTIVYEPDYKLDSKLAEKMLSEYETVIKNTAIS